MDAAWLHDPSGVCPRLSLLQVPEPKIVKNRVHLDLRVFGQGTPDEKWSHLTDEVARLSALGAAVVQEFTGRQRATVRQRDEHRRPGGLLSRSVRRAVVVGLGARDGAWSGDGLVVRRRKGAAIAQYHPADSCRVRRRWRWDACRGGCLVTVAWAG